MKPDFTPRNCKLYPLSPSEEKAMNEFIDENLAKGAIVPSQSPQASPFFFVGKKDGSLRPCQDYRYLNEWTVKNAYPLPRITDLLDKLKGAKIFTKMDIRWGYNNVRIHAPDRWKAAFKTARGLFEPTVMFFGLCNAPATFQAMMNDLFADMIDEGWLVIYVDDLLIFSQDIETHHARTARVLQRLREHQLCLKPEKCTFDATEIEYLGLIIRPERICMDPVKLDGVVKWQQPTTVKQVHSFLGFANFYRRFIANYSNIARPLINLTKKDIPFLWSKDCETAFNDLKEQFLKAPVLAIPDKEKPFAMAVDASLYATGGVLLQKDPNGDWHPCSYISQSFSPAERNYQIYDRELLAIHRGLMAWRHYLEGSPFPVLVMTDHKNLTYFRAPQNLSCRQVHWQIDLSVFDLQLLHVPGKDLSVPDALSRRADHIPTDGINNANKTLLPNHLFIKVIDAILQDKLRLSSDIDPIVQTAIDALSNKSLPLMRSALSDWKLENSKDASTFHQATLGRNLLNYIMTLQLQDIQGVSKPRN